MTAEDTVVEAAGRSAATLQQQRLLDVEASAPAPCSRFLERLIIMKELEKNSCSRVVALATSASVTEDAAAVVAETVAVADVQSRK